MSSPQVIDGAKMQASIARFLSDQTREKQDYAIDSAQAKHQAAIAPKDNGIDMTDAEAQKGRMMTRAEFVKKVESLNPHLFCDPSLADPSKGAVYIRDYESNLDSPIPKYRGTRFLASFPWSIISEHDLVLTKQVAYGEEDRTDTKSAGKIPGWRSVLARLIKNRVISIPRAEQVFKISRGRESERWWNAFQ